MISYPMRSPSKSETVQCEKSALRFYWMGKISSILGQYLKSRICLDIDKSSLKSNILKGSGLKSHMRQRWADESVSEQFLLFASVAV